MPRHWTFRFALAFYVLNLVAIVASVADGYARGEPALRFEEKQAITFLSANQLGATALLAWIVFVLRDRLSPAGPARGRSHGFWAISAVGFLYLMLDESFQFHEGMDTAVVRLFGGSADPMVDGAATFAYGLAAAALCIWFRAEILRHPHVLRLFAVGGVFLLVTSALNAGEATQTKIVLEESAKLLGVVSFFLGHFAAFAGVVSELREARTDLLAPRGR